tara:strand:- start:1237 stop:1416 length:180 start_codon:yes stop_codon:yes gene_type:complete
MSKTYWIYDSLPPNQSAKVLLLTAGGICILGDWANHYNGCIAWHPLPSRNRDEEKRLGL